ncbi:hypothetical protein KCU78_g13427, partial [Aureobasidium melanogenum]
MAGTRIPHLPNEILYEIAGYVDDEDILNLRLSAKVFQYITIDRFATTFFEDRAYELSPKGLEALVKITEHSVFAPHIRTVIIGHGGKHSSAKYHGLLDQAFRNLATLGNAISIGLRRVHTAHNYQPLHSQGCQQMVNFFRHKMLAAAFRARLPLKDIVADVQSDSQNRSLTSHSDYWASSLTHHFEFLASIHNQLRGLRVKFSTKESDSTKPSYIFLDLRDDKVQVSQTGDQHWHTFLSYGSLQRLREIYLEDCDVDYDLFRTMLRTSYQQLECLSLYNVHIESPWLSPRTVSWRSLFRTQSRSLSVLKSCKFGKLQDQDGGVWLEGDEKTIEANTRAHVITVLSNLAAGVRTFELDG